MAHMLDHFGPSLESPWTRLAAPELTPELRNAVVEGCDIVVFLVNVPRKTKKGSSLAVIQPPSAQIYCHPGVTQQA